MHKYALDRQIIWGYLFLIVCVMGLGTIPSAYGTTTLGHWRFEEGSVNSQATGLESILDQSGNMIHGSPDQGPFYRADTPVNTIVLNTDSNTRSFDFNGVDQKITFDDQPIFQLTASLTIEVWINVRSLPTNSSGHGMILFRGDNRGGLDPYFLSIESNGLIRFSIQDDTQANAILEAPLPSMNQWLHVAGTMDDSTGQMSLYYNGVQVSSTFTTIRPFAELDPGHGPGVAIGGHVPSNVHSMYFDGMIDEVRLSNAALTPNQFLFLTGDLNGDGFVGIADLNTVLTHWNTAVAPGDLQKGDHSGDGFVGIDDLNTVLGNWNAGVPPTSSSVPEPAGLALLGIGGLMIPRRWGV